MDLDFIKILITVFLASFGWLTVNYLTDKREIKAKKRELVTKYQIETFTALNTFFTYLLIKQNPPPEVRAGFNKAVSMVQLLGSQSQIDSFSLILKKMQQITSAHSGGIQGAEIEVLLQGVRNELRRELGLTQTNNNIISMLSFEK